MIIIPRPKKRRNIGFSPEFMEFGPHGKHCKKEPIYLKIEELESLRLMDLENLDQTECADKMNIGRTTLQRIYKHARFKVADSIINGKKLIVEEDVLTCDSKDTRCHRHGRK